MIFKLCKILEIMTPLFEKDAKLEKPKKRILDTKITIKFIYYKSLNYRNWRFSLMYSNSVIEKYNESTWDSSKFTKPNGNFETNADNQLTFVPNLLPPSISYGRELIMLLAQAERKVGELKGKCDGLKNPHILIRAYLKREAVLSSKIEGTLASLEDLNKQEAVGNIGLKTAKNLRLHEVINYVNALESALEKIKDPDHVINLNVIKNAHKVLMARVRGHDKNPGQFRVQQNWIAEMRGNKQRIIYTPPPPEKIFDLLENLETFIQSEHRQTSVLVQCAIIHYQFEAIHPFLDGNGRIGRLLLPLILYKKGLLPKPLLYLSAYFDKHQNEYYKGLLTTSQKSKWRDWVIFFLRAFEEQADETIKNIQTLADLEKKYKEVLIEQNASTKAMVLMEHMFENPYITIPRAMKFLKNTYPSAKSTVMTLVDAGILQQTDISYRSKVFLAREIEKALDVS